ncbi:hypothetical protein ACLBXJ_15630 [Methylobacterium mesophilicum]
MVYDDRGRVIFTVIDGLKDQQAGYEITTPAGEMAVMSTSKIRFFRTDNHGPTLETRNVVAPAGQTWIAGNLQVTETPLTDTTSTFTVTDLATGASWQDPTTYTRSIPVVGQDGIWLIPNGSTAVTQADPGFKVFLTASGGRAARARLAKVDYSTRPMLRRWGVGSATPVTLSPWRRPLTTDTFARAYTFNANPAGNFVRGGKLYRRISLSVFEVELGLSQGIVEKGGLRYTRHAYAQHSTTIYGVLCLTAADGLTLIHTGRNASTRAMSVLQDLGSGDVPTGEFISEVTGTWTSTTESGFVTSSVTSGTLRVPVIVAMNNIMVTSDNGKALVVYDLAGNFVRTSAEPGGTIGPEWIPTSGRTVLDGGVPPTNDIANAFFHVASHDLLVRIGYDKLVLDLRLDDREDRGACTDPSAPGQQERRKLPGSDVGPVGAVLLLVRHESPRQVPVLVEHAGAVTPGLQRAPVVRRVVGRDTGSAEDFYAEVAGLVGQDEDEGLDGVLRRRLPLVGERGARELDGAVEVPFGLLGEALARLGRQVVDDVLHARLELPVDDVRRLLHEAVVVEGDLDAHACRLGPPAAPANTCGAPGHVTPTIRFTTPV